MLELVEPTPRMMRQWHEAYAEWGPGAHEDGFGLLPTADVATSCQGTGDRHYPTPQDRAIIVAWPAFV